MEKIRHNKQFWLALTIFSLTGQVAWTVENMYFNVFIYKMFHASASAISAMVAASAAAATVTTLLIGALSDKLGKRKIFICGGYLAWGVSIMSFALLRTDLLTGILPATVSAASEAGQIGLVSYRDSVLQAIEAAEAVYDTLSDSDKAIVDAARLEYDRLALLARDMQKVLDFPIAQGAWANDGSTMAVAAASLMLSAAVASRSASALAASTAAAISASE